MSGSGRIAEFGYEPEEDIDPWDQQTGESDKAYEAFIAYRSIAVKRSIKRASVVLGKSSVGSCAKWCQQWGWTVRVLAWDVESDKLERRAALQAADDTVRQKLQVADGLWKTAAKGLVMWSRYIDYMSGKQVSPDGTVTRPPITPHEVQRLAEAGLKLSQLLEGKPTDILDQRKQITIDERRRGIHKFIGNPKVRQAMRKVTEAMEEQRGDDGIVH